MHGTGLITSYTSPNYDSDLKEIIRGSREYHSSGIKSPYARICSIQATDQDYPPGRMLNTAEQYKTDLFPVHIIYNGKYNIQWNFSGEDIC